MRKREPISPSGRCNDDPALSPHRTAAVMKALVRLRHMQSHPPPEGAPVPHSRLSFMIAKDLVPIPGIRRFAIMGKLAVTLISSGPGSWIRRTGNRLRSSFPASTCKQVGGLMNYAP